MKKFTLVLLSAIFLSLNFSGCAQKAIPASRAGEIAKSYPGVIEAIEDVQIQGDGQITSITGMIAGGVLGSKVGGGEGQDLATMAGAMLGSVLGQKADVRAAKRVTIKLQDGNTITTVLPVTPNNPLNFKVGDSVKVFISNNKVTEIR